MGSPTPLSVTKTWCFSLRFPGGHLPLRGRPPPLDGKNTEPAEGPVAGPFCATAPIARASLCAVGVSGRSHPSADGSAERDDASLGGRLGEAVTVALHDDDVRGVHEEVDSRGCKGLEHDLVESGDEGCC